MRIRIIDFETNGTEPTDAVVQIGFCDVVVGDKAILGPPSSMFVNGGQELKPAARAIHHIRPKDIANAPPVEVGMQALQDGDPDIYCAHRAVFEQQYFNPVGSKWICTMKVGRRLWPDSPGHSNQCLRYHLNIDDDEGFEAWHAMPPHRAGPDCYVTAWLLCEALKHATVEQMIEWSGQPSLLPGAINFGKHRGTPWPKIDPSYLDWLTTKATDMDPDVVFTAKHWLNRRMADAR